MEKKITGKPDVSKATDWGEVANWYDQLVGEAGSEYHREVVLPGVIRLLQPQRRQKIIDLACGQGVLCRLLHSKGAEVTGIDAAESLIRVARERGPAQDADRHASRLGPRSIHLDFPQADRIVCESAAKRRPAHRRDRRMA